VGGLWLEHMDKGKGERESLICHDFLIGTIYNVQLIENVYA